MKAILKLSMIAIAVLGVNAAMAQSSSKDALKLQKARGGATTIKTTSEAPTQESAVSNETISKSNEVETSATPIEKKAVSTAETSTTTSTQRTQSTRFKNAKKITVKEQMKPVSKEASQKR